MSKFKPPSALQHLYNPPRTPLNLVGRPDPISHLRPAIYAPLFPPTSSPSSSSSSSHSPSSSGETTQAHPYKLREFESSSDNSEVEWDRRGMSWESRQRLKEMKREMEYRDFEWRFQRYRVDKLAEEFWIKMNLEFQKEKSEFLNQIEILKDSENPSSRNPSKDEIDKDREVMMMEKPRLTMDEAMTKFYSWWLDIKSEEYREFQKTWTKEQWGLVRPGWEAWRRSIRWRLTKAWYERFG